MCAALRQRDYTPAARGPLSGLRVLDLSRLFAGNVDDDFRLGVAVGRRALKLYVDFYEADLIIASPLGQWFILVRDVHWMLPVTLPSIAPNM